MFQLEVDYYGYRKIYDYYDTVCAIYVLTSNPVFSCPKKTT